MNTSESRDQFFFFFVFFVGGGGGGGGGQIFYDLIIYCLEKTILQGTVQEK